MIGKIVKGTSFGGCVNYVLKEEKARLLEAVGVEGTPSEMAEQFELQTLLNEKVKNTVGHISLNFSPEDAARLARDDDLMLKIAHDYMRLMGIENTQFIIARHIDREHPHCHIVFNRVDNDGRTISDKNDRFRNERVCKMLTARYRLHFSEGRRNVKFERLRNADKVKHYIYVVLRRELANATSWSELRRALRGYKIDTEFKLNRRTGSAEGVKFKCMDYTFSGSKIHREFSFDNIDSRLKDNAIDAGLGPRRNTPTPQREEPRQEVRQEQHEESSLTAGLLDLTNAPATDPEEEMLAKQYVKKKKKPQRKRGFRL